MIFKRILPFFILLTASFANLAYADEALNAISKHGVLRVGTEANYYPFEFLNENGQLVGFDIDIANHMAETMGVKLEIVDGTVDSLIPGLIANKYDIFIRGITLTAKRNLKANFANPYFIAGQTIIIRKELQNTIKSYKDLNHPKFKIVSKVGTTGEMAAKKFIAKAEYTSFDTEQEALLELINNRADAFVFDFPYNTIALKKFGKQKLVHLNKPFTYEPLAWVVKQGNHDFMNWLNNYLNQIQNDGTYEKFYKKWFITYDYRQ